MKKTIFLFLLIFFITDNSFAETYKWIDEEGNTHYTDDYSQVPDKYRNQAEKIELPEDGVKESIKPESTPTVSTPDKKSEDYKDRLGRGEEYWKQRVEEWKKKKQENQDKLEVLRVKYNDLTEKYNSAKSLGFRTALRNEREQIKTEMDECKIKIEKANEMLEKKIPEEAELYKAKPEWIKY